jgi:lysophospholipase L1-like esterase
MKQTAIFSISLILLALPVFAESRWEPNIKKFEAQDAKNPPAENGIVFVGSSSMVFWKTDTDFPDLHIINRGFGGSQTADSVEFAPRIVLKYKPRLVALYAGDNDIAAGKSPAEVVAVTEKFFALVHEALPDTRILYVAIKPSISRWDMVGDMREVNRQVKAITEKDARLDFIDIDTPMLGDDGKPRKELFIKDGLHLNRAGYDLWNSVIQPYLTPKK